MVRLTEFNHIEKEPKLDYDLMDDVYFYMMNDDDFYRKNYFARSFSFPLINHKQIKDGITITAVNIKNVPQSPFNQSTKAPEEDARVVLPAVPIEASNAYCVAV